MKRIFAVVLFILATISVTSVYHPVYGQRDDEAVRNQTREQLAKLLEKAGPTVNVAFSQSQKQPYNYVGTLRTGLVNTESFEIVISVTPKETIGFRIYPHYKNGYINVDKVNDRAALMRLLLRLSDRAFLFWGADETGDIFTGYTFTLESGFPEEAISIVLKSIVNSDKFVGEMRPLLDAPIEDVTVTSPPAAPPAKAAPAKARVPLRRSRRQRS
ncbi:MAG TPA: hypothetical protein VGJ48_14010 [Pyrinomonadaceae bacterium]